MHEVWQGRTGNERAVGTSGALLAGIMMETSREELNRRAHVLAERAQLFSGGLDTHGPSPDVSDADAERELKSQCQELKTRIAQIRAECSRYPEVPTFDDKESPVNLILQQKRLRVELSVWQKQPTNVLSSRSSVIEADTHQKLRENIEQLQTTLAAIREERRATKKKLEREKEQLQETEQLEEALKQKVAAFEEEQHSAFSGTQLEGKLRSAEGSCTSLKESLNKFVSEHILQPQEEVETTQRKKQRGMRQTTIDAMIQPHGGRSSDEFPNLADVIQLLITKTLDTPHDPYISVDSIWQPHFHLLLRSGVLQRHPDNPTLIRITPFHH